MENTEVSSKMRDAVTHTSAAHVAVLGDHLDHAEAQIKEAIGKLDSVALEITRRRRAEQEAAH